MSQSIKERLKNYRCNQAELISLAKRIEILRNRLECKSPTISFSSKSTASSEEVMIKYLELLHMYKEREKVLANEQIELEKMIATLDNPERMVIVSRYIDGKSWQEIANIKFYSLRHVQRIHGQALENLKSQVAN